MNWHTMTPTEKLQLFNQISNHTFVELSLSYARLYEENPHAFISSYKKFDSIKMACNWITYTYKHIGAFDEVLARGKDISKWIAKQDLTDYQKKDLENILLIIDSILHP